MAKIATRVKANNALVDKSKVYTPEEAIEACKKHAEGVEGDLLEIDTDALDNALETLRDGDEYGVEF